ncbi:MAG: hypothetical protein PWQ87_628 [Candidatus Woesearchaeota archaeon]|nr:hypothetical protein [Candidatus Woesearchaeota archaeon]
MKIKRINIRKDAKEINERNIRCNLDDKGFFLIRVIQKKKEIEVGFCNYEYEITHIFRGKDVEKLYKTIIKEINIDNKQHLCYLGKELQKAKDAIIFGCEYIQDEELKKNNKKVIKSKIDKE